MLRKRKEEEKGVKVEVLKRGLVRTTLKSGKSKRKHAHNKKDKKDKKTGEVWQRSGRFGKRRQIGRLSFFVSFFVSFLFLFCFCFCFLLLC